jgi:hypothetical protein
MSKFVLQTKGVVGKFAGISDLERDSSVARFNLSGMRLVCTVFCGTPLPSPIRKQTTCGLFPAKDQDLNGLQVKITI